DMIISGGFNVYPAEVEQALMAFPEVQDCAVIGVPDEKWGEAVVAVVEPRAGRSIDTGRLLEEVREVLGPVKTPKAVEVMDSLPRSNAGKVLRAELRRERWEKAGRTI
ncbi:MAG: fatty acid--CoA ligase, partial [Novosphingobium sp.]|nr:fatty acid--CoA ligase [Novosphingobium sp.]